MNLYDILMSDDVILEVNKNLDYILKIIPEINYMIGFEHKHPHHHLDVWNHTLYALSLSEVDFDIRVALLFHDIGKPFSYQEGEIRHFHNHPSVSAEMTRKILEHLDFKEEFINKICYLVKYHDTPISQKQMEQDYQLSLKLYKIQYCDAMAHNPNMLDKRKKYLEETYSKIKQMKLKNS